MGKIWAISSGSGGVGKSMLAVSLAAGAAKHGKKTILLDVSGISRSCDMVLGMESVIVLDMMDVVRDQAAIEAAVYPVGRYEGLGFACASLYDHVPVSEFSSVILALHSLCDVLVIDLPTGQTDLGRGLLRKGDELLLVVRPDQISIRSAERLLMHAGNSDAGVSIVVNRSMKERLKKGVQLSREAVQMILDRPVLAEIPEDASISMSERMGKAAIECDGPAWTSLKALTEALLSGV